MTNEPRPALRSAGLRRGVTTVALAFAGFVTAAGCVPVDQRDDRPPAPRPVAGAVAADLPVAFAATGILLGDDVDTGFAAADGVGYLVTTERGESTLRAVALATADERWSLPLTGRPNGGAETGPVLVDAGDRRLVLVATVRASETGAPGGGGPRVVAVRASDGAVAWQADLDDDRLPPRLGGDDVLTVAAADERYLVVTVHRNSARTSDEVATALVDTATGHLLWTAADFLGLGLAGGVVAGLEISPPSPGGSSAFEAVVGRSAASGAPVWRDDELDPAAVVGAGLPREVAPGVVVVAGRAAGRFDRVDRGDGSLLSSSAQGAVFAASDGTVLAELPDDPTSCVHDLARTLVCQVQRGQAELFAVDTGSGEALWNSDDVGGSGFVVTAARGRVLYGFTRSGRTPGLVDAVTGVAYDEAPGLAPDLVVSGFGLVADADEVWAYAAVR